MDKRTEPDPKKWLVSTSTGHTTWVQIEQVMQIAELARINKHISMQETHSPKSIAVYAMRDMSFEIRTLQQAAVCHAGLQTRMDRDTRP